MEFQKPGWLFLSELTKEIQDANAVKILYEFLKKFYIEWLR